MSTLSGHLLEALDHKQQIQAYAQQFPNARTLSSMHISTAAANAPPPTPLRTVDNPSDGVSARQAAIHKAQHQDPLQNPSLRARAPRQPEHQLPFKPTYIIQGPPEGSFSNLPTPEYGSHHGMANPYLPPAVGGQDRPNPYMTQMAPAANASYKSNGFGNGGGFSAPMLMTEYTAGQLATLQSRLSKKLGPEYITKRPGPGGGPKLSYIEGWKVINLANEVFGFNGWSSQIMSLNTDFIDQTSEGRFNVGISAIIRIILRDGSFHEDTGYGQCDNTKGKGAALDKAKKEAVTDGVKRTLRSFGNVLGNCLYDKEYTKEVEKIKIAPVPLQRRDLWRRPELDDTGPEDPNTALPPSCRPHPNVEALNEQHLNRQTAGPSVAASRMRPRPNTDLYRSAEFAVPALPAHVKRESNNIVGGDARAAGQSIARPMTTALEEEFGMDEEHLATMDLDDPATMPTGADFAIDTSYDGSVFDQSVDSISVASTSASTIPTRQIQRNIAPTEGSSLDASLGPAAAPTNLKTEQRTSSDDDEKEAMRRRRRAALMESAQQQQQQQQQEPNGMQTDGFGRDSANGSASKPPPVGGFRFPSDMAVNGNVSHLGGGRSVSDPAATANRAGTSSDFSSARVVNRFQQHQNAGSEDKSHNRGNGTTHLAQRRPLGELDPGEVPFEPGSKRSRA